MKSKFHLAFIILASCLSASFADLPPDIQKCKSTDNDDCIAKSIMKVMELYSHGNSEFGLQDITAIAIEEIVFADNPNSSPMQLNFKLKKLIVKGLEKLKVLRVHGFNKNVTKAVELEFLLPKISLYGDYEMMGKLLLFPLNGQGKGKIDFIDMIFKFKAKISLENRNNKTYGVIEKFKLREAEPKRMVFKLQNIVNNNAVLSETLNEVINENWRDIWKEFEKNTIETSENVVANIIKAILQVLPVNDFYSD